MSRNGSSRTSVVLSMIAVVLIIAIGTLVVLILMENAKPDPASAPTAVTETVIESATPAPPPEVTTPEYTPPPAPAGSAVVQGGQCLPSEARSFGTDANGQSLVCTYMGADGGYRWVQHAPNSGQVHNIGDPCDPAVDSVAQDPSGKAIMCGGQTWVDGP